MSQLPYSTSPGYNAGSLPVEQSSVQAPVYGKAYDDNLQRYNDTLAGYQAQQAAYSNSTGGINTGYRGMVNAAKGLGQTQMMQVQQNFQRQQAQNQQSMMSRGLGNSSIMDSANRGTAYDQQMAQLGVQDQVNQNVQGIRSQQLGYLAQAQGGMANLQAQQAGFMGSKTNTPTNASQNVTYGYPQNQNAGQIQNQQISAQNFAGSVNGSRGTGSGQGTFYVNTTDGPAQYGYGYNGGGTYPITKANGPGGAYNYEAPSDSYGMGGE